MNKLEQAARQALEALESHQEYGSPTLLTGVKAVEAITALREALAEQAEHEPFDMNDHPPHRLCECRKCMEYFTPLPDCDAFAAFGKPIAEQTNTQLMEGYRIGLAEMREKCAKVAAGYDATPWKHCQTSTHAADMVSASIAAAIRAINFEGDTGFRPVSEMIAEHKQDPKKAAAIEKAKMRKAEQEPVAWRFELKAGEYAFCSQKHAEANKFMLTPENHTIPLYAAPVRTKDLTDDEIAEVFRVNRIAGRLSPVEIARAVIAADREKNRGR